MTFAPRIDFLTTMVKALLAALVALSIVFLSFRNTKQARQDDHPNENTGQHWRMCCAIASS